VKSPHGVLGRARGIVLGLALVLGSTVVLLPVRDTISIAAASLVLVLPGVVAAWAGGRAAALVSALAAALAFNLAFLPPYWTLKVDLLDDLIALVVFVAVALTVGTLVALEAERRSQAEQRSAEIAELYAQQSELRADQQRLAAEKVAAELVGDQRSALLRSVSHDLRTPLTSLVGLSESLTLSRPPLAAAQMELANALRDEARRMSTLVANLLDMARIQSGGVTLNLQWQMVEETIGSALRACRWQLGARTVDTRIPRGLPLVRFDATLLERVLCNLLENAGKYTPPDAHVTIAARAEDGQLFVAVCDDGPGLPAGREDALFEKFVRGRQESSIAGVGLGLAICRAIVEAHGGRMRAFNRPDAGARFELSLPLGEPPPLPDMDPEHHDHPIDQHEH
jgi:K+-sensing histidine kinase KdpD